MTHFPIGRRVAAATGIALISGALGVAPAAAAPAPPVPAYTLTLLAPPESGNQSAALGVNDTGVVVGTARTSTTSRPQFATSWTDGTAANLGGLPEATFSRAFDVNAGGISVGEAFTPSPESSRAVAFTPEGISIIGSLNESGSGVANDINDRGLITGTSFNGTFSRAFLGRTGAIKELPVPAIEEAVTTTRGNAVSPDGDVAGVSFVVHPHDDHTHTIGQATIWNGFEATLLETTEDELSSQAYGLNDSGVVVGEENDGTNTHAAVWDEGEISRLPGLASLRHARANAVNEAGDIVGHATGFVGNTSFDGLALLWRDGEAIDLNTQVDLPEGVILRNAQDINESGVIVGSAATPDGGRGFVLEPREIADSHLHVDSVETSYGLAGSFEVEVHSAGPVDGTVTLHLDGRERGSAPVDENGVALVSAPDALRPGTYEATLTYSGTTGTDASSETVELLVTRARPAVDTTATVTGRKVAVSTSVTIPGSTVTLAGYVKIRVPGVGSRVVRLNDGAATATFRKVSPGRHVVVAKHLPSDLAASALDTERFRIQR